jgi:VWFA-related protein
VAALAQDSQYKIRAKVDLVVVPVTVKGSGGKLVTGLKKEDFTVYEDARKQTITDFSIDPVPLSAAVVVDSGLSADSLSKVQQTFSALAGAFSEFDEVAVYRYDKFVTKIIDFSQDNERIETAMKTMRELTPDTNPALASNPRGPFALNGPVINGQQVLPNAVMGILAPEMPQIKVSKVLHDAMFAAATDLAKREKSRRKMVLVISDGDTTGSDHSFNDASQALLAIGAGVYAIGLDQPFPYKKFSVLEDYAKLTGGDTFFVDSLAHIERAYMSAAEQARNQYVLGYISNNDVTGAGPVFRAITVRLADPDLRAIHRKGYFQYP